MESLAADVAKLLLVEMVDKAHNDAYERAAKVCEDYARAARQSGAAAETTVMALRMDDRADAVEQVAADIRALIPKSGTTEPKQG